MSQLITDHLKAAVDIVGISNFVTFLENTQDYRRDVYQQAVVLFLQEQLLK